MTDGSKKLPTDGAATHQEGREALHHIVGVGASAGGLEALERLFTPMPTDTGLAFVVVQHLSPDFKSQMEELLARRTQLAVRRVEHGMLVEADTIYLIPPKMMMIISEGRLLLTEKDPNAGLLHPIDVFFRSLAVELGRGAIAVVLSGTGSDGTRGIEEVYRAGGLVIAQNPESASFDGMPRSAADSGFTHLQSAPGDMGALLERYVEDGLLPESLADTVEELPTSGLEPVLDLLEQAYRIDFTVYKSSTVTRRIMRRIEFAGVKGVDEYVELLQDDNAALSELCKDLLIGVTSFRRDEQAFTLLEKHLFDEVLAKKREGDTLRIWAPGCATGEEAYSLAMLIRRAVTSLSFELGVKVFATDVHRSSLAKATKGIYSADDVKKLTPEERREGFMPQDGEFIVREDLRKMVMFVEHNVLSQPPFTQQDLVVCRNLLIYFQAAPQKRVLSLFHFALRPGGLLFLGPSETVGDLEDEFEPLSKRWRIFKKTRDVKLPIEQRLAVSPKLAALAPLRERPVGRGIAEKLRSLNELYGEVIDRVVPLGAVVSDNFDIIQMFGAFSELISVSGRVVSNNLLQLIEPSLKTTLSGALTHANREHATVRYSGVRIRLSSGVQTATLLVRPLGEPTEAKRPFLITFEHGADSKDSLSGEQPVVDTELNTHEALLDHIRRLEHELAYARENLQATVEELETSNEELQATNEELVAGNEELQSTNEELQSVNEEIYTVNAEYQRNIAQLSRSNSDMDNLLTSTEVGVFFLDEEFKLRRFTPELATRFALEVNDTGSPFDRLAYSIDALQLRARIEESLEATARFEEELKLHDGTPILLRVLPYKSPSGEGGMVGTVIDLSTVRRAESLIGRFKFICDRSPDLLAMLDEYGRFTYVNQAFCESIGRGEEECLKLTVAHVDPDWSVERYQTLFAEVHEGEPKHFESRNAHVDGSIHPVEVTVAPFVFEGEQVLFSQSRDITARKSAEQRLAFEHRISVIAAQAETLTQAAEDFLEPFVDLLDMDAAEFWRFEAMGAADKPGQEKLTRQSQVVREGLPGGEEWVDATNGAVVKHGVGLLGEAWSLGTARWAEDISAMDGFERADAAQSVRLRTGCAFPVLDGEAVIGIIAFFSTQPQSDPIALLDSVEALGRTIGQTCKRLETERALHLRDRAVNATYDGIVIADARLDDLPLVYVNTGFESITGYKASEVLSRNCRFLQGEDTDPESISRIREAVKQRKPIREVLRNYRKDGTPFWNELQMSPVLTSDGTVDHFVAVQHDITDRVRIEEDLKAAQVESTRANQAKSLFLANMSHEIRSPMAAILGFTDALRSEVSSDSGRKHLGVIRRNGRYLLQIINDILDISKIEAGQLTVVTEAVSPSDLLNDVRQLLSVRAEEAGVAMKFVASTKLPTLMQADATRLRQVLVNLISNAIKFSPMGAVVVTVAIDRSEQDPSIVLTVADDGIGIAADQLDAIFEPFSQVRTASSAETSGTGLGLAITRRLVRAMGGEIQVESKPGEGSTFTVSLSTGPLENTPFVEWDSSETAPADEEIAVSSQIDLTGLRVLVVDDRRELARVVTFYLEDVGASVTHASDGSEAVDAALAAKTEGQPFAAVLMDMQMPVMDGLEATRQLRAKGYDGKIIALTAGATTEESARCLGAGCDIFLAKPVGEAELIETLARATGRL